VLCESLRRSDKERKEKKVVAIEFHLHAKSEEPSPPLLPPKITN